MLKYVFIITSISRRSTGGWMLALMERRIYDCAYIHVFNIHLCLLLQLDNNLPVEPLELRRENTHLKFITTYIILHAHCAKRNVQFGHMAQCQRLLRVE